jgi:Domain of unknown function (DUF4136)
MASPVRFALGRWRGAAAVAGVALLTACATAPQIHSQVSPDADFSSYRTFGFMPRPSTDPAGYKTLTTKSIERGVRREMQARGYAYADDAELIINFSITSKDKIEGQVDPAFAVGYGRGRFGWGWGIGGAYDDIRTVTEGSLTIDVVDRARNELIWSGTAVGPITRKALDNPDPAIDRAVTDIFKRYPPKAAAPAAR